MNTKLLNVIFFLCNLFGIVPICLAAFNIYRDQIQEHMLIFLVPLWIGVIGSFALPKYESWVNEREMRKIGSK